MSVKIALAGNPNSGKTTLFNSLTGSNQFVGNWPGVTVEKKEGKLKGHKDVTIMDLPGIYSLSPYTLEEVVARNYLINERPDAILNIVDGTNLERNLYLTTQLAELGIPVVMAVNMMDVVNKSGNELDFEKLSKVTGCEVVPISALKGTGIKEAADKAVAVAGKGGFKAVHSFDEKLEGIISEIEGKLGSSVPEEQKRFYAIKLFERDEKISGNFPDVSDIIEKAEKEYDDDSESIITNARYEYITSIIKDCYKKKVKQTLTTSDKIDKVVTNRWLALPIFAVVMFIVYYIAVTTVGTFVTDWTNDGLFGADGDGWHLFGIGTAEYEEAVDDFYAENVWSQPSIGKKLEAAAAHDVVGAGELLDAFKEEDAGAFEEAYESYADSLAEAEDGEFDITPELAAVGIAEAEEEDEEEAVEDEEAAADSEEAVAEGEEAVTAEDAEEATDSDAPEAEEAEEEEGEEIAPPDPSEFGIWIPGIATFAAEKLEAAGTAEWLSSLIVEGIIGGVGAVLGFVPQMLVLFLLLAILEACGYMARIAFIMDRIFRRFGLSGKSFIPILIGTGCGVPGVMASRTIENERDRRMTIMTTTFIPCGAKLPIIALIASALFGGAWWVAPSAYFIGIAAIITSGIILKKTKMFAGDPAPFVMELPAYHLPTVGNVLRSMWERGWSFIKKAGTIILLSSIIIWLGSHFGWVEGAFGFSLDLELEDSILGAIGNAIMWIFAPLGFADIRATIATIMGLVAKEEVVGVFGVLDFMNLTQLAAYSFLVFNLLCAPCFAAIGAIRREMNSAKWTWFAIGYQCVFAYIVALCIYQIGGLFTGMGFGIGTVVAILLIALFIYLLVRPYKESTHLKIK